MDYYVQVVANGLLLGGLYALVAAGLALYFGTLRIVNLAHGEFIVVGSFLTFAGYAATGLHPLWGVPLGFVIGFLLGLAIYSLILRRARRGGEKSLILVTFGISILLIGLMRALWGATPRTVNVWSSTLTFWGITVPTIRLVVFSAAAAISVAVFAFLQKTALGHSIKCVADNESLARATGIDVERVYRLTFGMGAAITTAAGGLVGLLVSASPTAGAEWTFKAFAIVAAGGLGSVLGSMVAGVGLGIAETLTGATLGVRMANLVAFALLVVVLLLRRREEYR